MRNTIIHLSLSLILTSCGDDHLFKGSGELPANSQNSQEAEAIQVQQISQIDSGDDGTVRTAEVSKQPDDQSDDKIQNSCVGGGSANTNFGFPGIGAGGFARAGNAAMVTCGDLVVALNSQNECVLAVNEKDTTGVTAEINGTNIDFADQGLSNLALDDGTYTVRLESRVDGAYASCTTTVVVDRGE